MEAAVERVIGQVVPVLGFVTVVHPHDFLGPYKKFLERVWRERVKEPDVTYKSSVDVAMLIESTWYSGHVAWHELAGVPPAVLELLGEAWCPPTIAHKFSEQTRMKLVGAIWANFHVLDTVFTALYVST